MIYCCVKGDIDRRETFSIIVLLLFCVKRLVDIVNKSEGLSF